MLEDTSKLEGKGYWCDIVLASNDLLLLTADIVHPSTHDTSIAASTAELSYAELYHCRLGHPSRTATKFLAAKDFIPKEAAACVSDHRLSWLTCRGYNIPRQNILNPSTRPLEKLHIDLITVVNEGLNGEKCVHVITGQYSSYIDAASLLR
jgi:hypothetical protein